MGRCSHDPVVSKEEAYVNSCCCGHNIQIANRCEEQDGFEQVVPFHPCPIIGDVQIDFEVIFYMKTLSSAVGQEELLGADQEGFETWLWGELQVVQI